MAEQLNRGELMNRRDEGRMTVASLLIFAGLAYAAYRYKLLDSFRPENSALFWLSILWFAVSAVETFNKRMAQYIGRGEAPPYAEYPGLHLPLKLVQYSVLAYLLYLDWRWGLALYLLTFTLAVSPILEMIGKALMFLWLKKRIAD